MNARAAAAARIAAGVHIASVRVAAGVHIAASVRIAAAALVLAAVPAAAAAQLVAPKTIFENASVRVEVLALPPGTGTGRHQGIETEVGIVVEGAPTVDSPLAHQLLQPGSAYTLPGLVPHDIRNEGDRPLKMYIVLLKRCD